VLWVGTTLGTLAIRVSIRIAAFVRRRQSVPTRIVIAGTGPRASALWQDLVCHPIVRYELVALTDIAEAQPAPIFHDRLHVPIHDLESFFMHTVVDEVFVALPVRSRYEEIQDVLSICEHGGVHSLYLADAFSPTIARPRFTPDRGRSVVSMHVVHDDWRLAVKRSLDFVVAMISLILLLPVFLVVAIGIKCTSPGPIFFTQARYGLKKRRFAMFKFRTMVPDAEQRLAQLEGLNEATGAAFKIRKDPRITRFGRLLRRSSLDELPQLWNVVTGDMSLVGPRPMAVRDVSLFDEAWLMRRFSVRPGITCLWQVGGRSNLTFEEWMRLDLKYIDSWSLGLDVAILAQTLPAVLRGEGAA
jgi:exopolysaccharide biosynthesis polyprenyl glycosylphosphotransferase